MLLALQLSTALQPTKRMRYAAKNAEGKRACYYCCFIGSITKLSAHSITRSPTKERAVGYTVASVTCGWGGVRGGDAGQW